jgi:cytochrome c-type biogenesis protein CcmE
MPMHPLRRQRLFIVLFIVIGASVAAGLVFWALRDNMNFFYAPAQIARGEAPTGKTIRIGGLVVPGSLKRSESGLEVRFTVTDNQSNLDVSYQGILPDLFAEGQGIVAVGEMLADGNFRAAQVLAKHDENYMPPEVHAALKAGEGVGEAVEGARTDGR